MKITIDAKALVLLFILNLIVLSGSATFSYAQDKIIAVVNEDVITQKDLADFLSFMRLQLSQEYKGKALEEKIQSMRPTVLDRLIEDRLILQEAKRSDIKVDDSRVRARINEVKKEYPSQTQFHADLMKQGLTQGDIEKKIREQFMMFAAVDSKVRSKIIIKPDEVTEFYKDHKRELNTGESRDIEAISLEAYDLANTISYELKSGKKLEDLASRYPLIINRLTLKAKDGIRKEIAEAISKLGVNEVSDPVKIEDKFYVFRVTGINPSEQLTLMQAQGMIQGILFEKRIQEGLAGWLDEIKKNSYIKIMQD
ncbi:MAG: SurA N-terminal domain-containing protein [Candidatus Omnitrophota bacterium]|jgi:parvulin-like peptidyl-prolyl isomerase|nr:SurA N-terminal domain-containing protein [Candidatus Omnitrophota bacterium]MDD4982140.1 SurA N-terminal domain-containing protein [Candidatus Omnitrophota bacterium]MDD5665536.1 SurA N-terminal domain-containing protein [Candidatus Omnitrophota bacterium]